jgi:hypothetical protein
MAVNKRHKTEIECPWVDGKSLASNIAVGAGGGDKFELIGGDGVYLKRLVFYLEFNRLKGLKATLTNGKERTAGRTSAPNELSFDFKPGEEFSKIIMRAARVPSYDSLLCGGVVIHTASGRIIDAMATTKGGLQDEIDYNVGSGVCIGVFGRCGWEIDCLGFAMQKELLVG